MNSIDAPAAVLAATHSSTRHRAYIGLGANLGDPIAALQTATRRIAALAGCRIVARSRIWSSAPIDADGPHFMNAAIAIDTTLDAPALLADLRAIELDFGRLRPYRNAPRTLDLDILLFDQQTIVSDDLTVPHPRMHLRRFVLAPLLELDATIDIPGRGLAASLLTLVNDQACEPIAAPLQPLMPAR